MENPYPKGISHFTLSWIMLILIILTFYLSINSWKLPFISPTNNSSQNQTPVCGNNICETGEDSTNCPLDCLPQNGSNVQQFNCSDWNCQNTNPPSTIHVNANGTGEISQTNPNACDYVGSYYDSFLRGYFPWDPSSLQGTALPSGIS